MKTALLLSVFASFLLVSATLVGADSRPGGAGEREAQEGMHISETSPVASVIEAMNGAGVGGIGGIRSIKIIPGQAEMEIRMQNGTENFSGSVATIRTRLRERLRNMTCEEQCPSINISYNSSLKKAVIISSEMVVESNNTIEAENGSVYITTRKNVRKELRVLPETASETARLRVNYHTVRAVEIEGEDDVYYAVKGVQAGKILGLFEIEMEVQTDVDVETGDVRGVHRPWWSFLVF